MMIVLRHSKNEDWLFVYKQLENQMLMFLKSHEIQNKEFDPIRRLYVTYSHAYSSKDHFTSIRTHNSLSFLLNFSLKTRVEFYSKPNTRL